MPIHPPSPGAVVDGKYRLAERIGGGGMGDVFRAENIAASRQVAIKFLHPELAQNREVAQRFFQEAQAANRIRHANVVEVLDAGVGEMGPYIVMEYLDGESVGAALARAGRFEVEAAVATALPVLEALDAAHRVGIIHRDLKPENVFIAFDASRGTTTVRLLDFGIAKVLDATGPSPRTRTGVVFGTPDYLSPEQATGEGPLDGRSDLFAVGVLLYELVTGLRPFRAPTAVATAFKVVHADAPSIAATGVHVDTKLEAVVHRLLQKEPARRFPAAPEVIRELEKIVPDPSRRAVALARILGASRRLSLTPSMLEADRSPRDGSLTRRITPAFAQLATQPGFLLAPSPPPSVPSPRVSVRPSENPASDKPAPSPRSLVADSAKTLRSGPVVSERSLSERSLSERPLSERANGEPPDTPRIHRTREAFRAEAASSPPSSDAAGRTTMRPFPPRFAGRFQVRGPVLRSVDKVMTDLFGAQARDGIVAQMPESYAADFRNGSINALVAYELEALDAYMEYATSMLVHDPGRWREIGRLAVDGELHNVVRTLLRPAVDIGSVVRRGLSTWARLFSFGAWRVGATANGRVTLTIGELDAVAQPLRLWTIGVVEQTTRRAVRADVRVTITAGEQDFTPEMSCEIG